MSMKSGIGTCREAITLSSVLLPEPFCATRPCDVAIRQA